MKKVREKRYSVLSIRHNFQEMTNYLRPTRFNTFWLRDFIKGFYFSEVKGRYLLRSTFSMHKALSWNSHTEIGEFEDYLEDNMLTREFKK